MSEKQFYTVGYEGLTIERFVAAMLEAGVTSLVDVRDRAQSRKKGFSKTALSHALECVGIQYTHFKALGDPKNGREAARAGRVAEFKAIFLAVMETKPAIEAVKALMKISETGQTCLLCYERNAELCHRSLILAKVADNHALRQIDLMINEKSISYEKKRRMPYPHQSIAA
jgi:uncharacterized protein (DUF488 family)